MKRFLAILICICMVFSIACSAVVCAEDTGEYTLTGEPSNTIIVDIPADKTYIIGDVDGNGAVDILDATFVQRYATGLQTPVSPESMMHGDIDGDGAVGIIDATFIQRYSTALAIPYPIDCPSA